MSESAPDEEPTARQRLRRGLTRPARGQIVVALLLAVVGYASVTQVRIVGADDTYETARREDLIRVLDGLAQGAQRLQVEIEDLEATREALRTSTDRSRTALEQAREQIDVLSILAGTQPAAGPGVRIAIDDPVGGVDAATLVNALAELRDAGAEAIEISDLLRVVASTEIVDAADGGVLADGVRLDAPFALDAIGDPYTLSEAMRFPGSLVDEVSERGGSATVSERDRVEILSLHDPEDPRYARPAD